MGGILVMDNRIQPVKEDKKMGETEIRHEGDKLNFLFVNVRQRPRQGKKGEITLQRYKYFRGVMRQMLPLHLNLCFKLSPEPVQPQCLALSKTKYMASKFKEA